MKIIAVDTSGALCDSTTSTSSAAPNYTLSGCGTGAVRVEFTIPDSTGNCCVDGLIDGATFGGSSYKSSVQFVNGNSTNVNFGILDPNLYAADTSGVKVFIPTMLAGNPTGGGPLGNASWFVGYPYNFNGYSYIDPPTNTLNGTVIGATWGVAYSKQANKIFTSAVVKRHTGLGTLGSGGIYLLQPSGNTFTASAFYDLDANGYRTRALPPGTPGVPAYGEGTSYQIANSGIFALPAIVTYLGGNDSLTGKPHGLGVIGTNVQRGLPTALNTPCYDPAAFDQAGKVGLGDIDISDDGKYLFVMNLYTRKLLRLELNDPKNPTSVVNVVQYTIPDPGCTNGVLRPWAVGFHRNKVFVGAVCSGENSGVNHLGGATDLYAYVYKLENPTGAATIDSTPVVSFPLNYQRGVSTINSLDSKKWHIWTNNADSTTYAAASNGRPSPILSDIEFSDRGDLLLDFMDRGGDQYGYANYWYLKTSLAQGVFATGGELLIAGNKCLDTFNIEKNGKTQSINGLVTGSGVGNNEGPGGGEFFGNDLLAGAHYEISQGGSAVIPGTGEVILTVMDPYRWYTGGTEVHSSINGGVSTEYEVHYNASISNFGKANGLGDIELIIQPPPIEVGNRVWLDTDKDGIQDAGESGLDGIIIKLFKNGVEVGSTTTTNNGQYFFNDKNVTGGLIDTSNYEIRIVGTQASLASFSLTQTDAGSNDLIDNDGTVSGTNIIKAFTTGTAGQNNHSYDFGFFECNMEVVSATPTACDPGTNTYTLTVIVNYTNPPSGNINVEAIGAGNISVAQTGSPQTIVMPGLIGTGVLNIDVKASFSNLNGCTHTLPDAYDAPDCEPAPCPLINCATGTVIKN